VHHVSDHEGMTICSNRISSWNPPSDSSIRIYSQPHRRTTQQQQQHTAHIPLHISTQHIRPIQRHHMLCIHRCQQLWLQLPSLPLLSLSTHIHLCTINQQQLLLQLQQRLIHQRHMLLCLLRYSKQQLSTINKPNQEAVKIHHSQWHHHPSLSLYLCFLHQHQ
jgi:hypothetical protein